MKNIEFTIKSLLKVRHPRVVCENFFHEYFTNWKFTKQRNVIINAKFYTNYKNKI